MKSDHLTVRQCCREFGPVITRTYLYQCFKAKTIKTVRRGGRRFVVRGSIEEHVASLPSEPPRGFRHE